MLNFKHLGSGCWIVVAIIWKSLMNEITIGIASEEAVSKRFLGAWKTEQLQGAFIDFETPAATTNIEALCFFMARDNLRQQDLPEIGHKAKVSEVLSGRRAINLRQAKALSERFNVDLSLFVD